MSNLHIIRDAAVYLKHQPENYCDCCETNFGKDHYTTYLNETYTIMFDGHSFGYIDITGQYTPTLFQFWVCYNCACLFYDVKGNTIYTTDGRYFKTTEEKWLEVYELVNRPIDIKEPEE